MEVRLCRQEILRLICDKYHIDYTVLKDADGNYTGIQLKEANTKVTWEGSSIKD